MVTSTRTQIMLPTLDGDPYEVIPGVELSLCHHDTRQQPVITDGYIGQVGGPYTLHFLFALRLWRTKELPKNIMKIMVIQLEGDNWGKHVEHGPFPGDDGELFETPVPIVRENGAICTSTQSNALKLIVIEEIDGKGFYSEHTVTVVAQRNRFYLVHQHNYDREEIFSIDGEGAYLPMNLAKGKQPKRLALADTIERAFEGKKLPAFQGKQYKPAPTGAKLKAGEARVVWWSAHRQVGGAVTHSGEQVRIFWQDIVGEESRKLRYFEPGTVVAYEKMIDSKGKTTYRHDLVGVSELEPAVV